MRQDIATLRIYYNQRLSPLLTKMEIKRKRLVYSMAIAILLILAGLIGVLVLKNFPLTILLFLVGGLVLVWSNQSIRHFKQTFKPQVISALLDFMDERLNYGALTFQPTQKIDIKDFISTGMVQEKPYKYLGEDHLTGKIGSFPFTSSELLVQEPAKVKGGLETVFKGFFFKIQMDQSYEGQLWAFSKKDKPSLSDSLKVIYGTGGYLIRDDEQVSLLFYATQDFPAAIFLNPGILNYLEDRKQELHTGFYWHIRDNNLYLAIRQDEDLLEPNIFKSNKRFDVVQKYYSQLSRLFEFVEIMEKYI
ncbi:MAG: DUF3137 domain-containing protein [Saprospiraceae bacterium]|nr:DUF3137 domain-containing protein [Saprospiraceae bacterium]